MVAERDRITPKLQADPDKTVAFVAEMDMDAPDIEPGAAVIYVCPMHPEVTSTEPARCPDCGMKLLPIAAPTAGYTCPMHPEVTSTEPARCPDCGMKLLPAHLVGSSVLAALMVRRRDLFSIVVAPPLVFMAVAGANIALAPSASFNLATMATLLVRGFPTMAIATGAALVLALIRWAARR